MDPDWITESDRQLAVARLLRDVAGMNQKPMVTGCTNVAGRVVVTMDDGTQRDATRLHEKYATIAARERMVLRPDHI